MISTLKVFVTAIVSFIAIDYIWLNFVAKKFYINQMNEVGRISSGDFQPIIWSAIACYIFLAIGITYFVLPSIQPQQSYLWVFLTGALFGMVCYGVYDTTNHATLKSWPVVLMAVDIAWGSFVTGVVTCITWYVRSL